MGIIEKETNKKNMSLDMFLGDNAGAPHVIYVGGGAVGSVGTSSTATIAAVNDQSLRVLAGEESVAEQLGTFTTGLVGGDGGDIRSTGTLDSFGYESSMLSNSLQFKPSISGVAAQKIDTIVGLSGGVESAEDTIGIGDEGEDGDEAVVFAPEPTIVRGGFVVDANGSVLGQTKSKPSPVRRPSRTTPPRPPLAASPAARRAGTAAAQTIHSAKKGASLDARTANGLSFFDEHPW